MPEPKSKLNGSGIDALASALRQVVEEIHEPVVSLLEEGLKEVNGKIDMTNKNMADQFSQQKKDISDEIKRQIGN